MHQTVFYSPYADTLDATWSGFADPDSGIRKLKIALLKSENGSCTATSSQYLNAVINQIEIGHKEKHYLFRSLLLMVRVYGQYV